MTTPLYALVGYVFWAIILVAALAIVRTLKVLRGEAAANDFPSGTPHGSDAYWRLNRAHMNTLENLPLFAAIVLAGTAAGLDSSTFATLARVCVLARVAQSLVHISSTSATAVQVRFTFFLVQLACIAWIGLLLVT